MLIIWGPILLGAPESYDTGNIPEAPELATLRYNGQNVGSQGCPL